MLWSGSLPEGEWPQCLAAIQQAIHARQQEGKDKRHTGFQRTPSLVAACLSDVLEALRRGSLRDVPIRAVPRGGFTDVGQHTGGQQARETTWPLVWAVIQVSQDT